MADKTPYHQLHGDHVAANKHGQLASDNTTSFANDRRHTADEGFIFKLTEAATMDMVIRRDISDPRHTNATTNHPLIEPPSKLSNNNNKNKNIGYTNLTSTQNRASISKDKLDNENDNDDNWDDDDTNSSAMGRGSTMRKLRENMAPIPMMRRHSSNVDENPHLVASNLVEFENQSNDGYYERYGNSSGRFRCQACYVACYYILRIFSVILSLFLAIIAVNYGLGQLVTLGKFLYLFYILFSFLFLCPCFFFLLAKLKKKLLHYFFCYNCFKRNFFISFLVAQMSNKVLLILHT